MIVERARAVDLLNAGRVVAYPTETVYGLGADALRADAVGALCALKGRDARRGLSVLVAGIEALLECVPALPDRALALARSHWPGPLTLVVPVPAGAFPAVATELGVGFRCSPQPTAAALVRALGRPLVSTSCNRSGQEPCRSAEEVMAVFGPELPIAGGEPADGQEPSTVVSISSRDELRLLRAGAIPAAELG